MKLKLGTRTSKMAMHQAELVKSLLQQRYPALEIELVPMKSDGDIPTFSKTFDGKGVFVKKLDEALLNGTIDFAVNCMKDIPNDHQRTPNIAIAAVLRREDIRDVLILRADVSKEQIHTVGFCIGTSSPRRRAVLRALYPNAVLKEIRGSSDTRVRKLDEGEVDALILAKAGMERIGLESRMSAVFEPNEFLPPLGAGIITMDALTDNENVIAILQGINDAQTYWEMQLERTFLNEINGDCYTPIGGYIEYKADNAHVHATVFSNTSELACSATVITKRNQDPTELGLILAEKILSQPDYSKL
jgi:hydroxymethylbilane synthase